MLDPDISARDARALLSVPGAAGLTPDGLNRRRFLQMVGLGIGGGALVGNLAPGLLPGAWQDEAFGAPLGPTEGVLVLITLYGGIDGLNTVVPFADGHYHDYRANLALGADDVLHVSADLGLHPSLGYVKSLWDQQQVAIVQGLGYANPDLSHFNSMAYWMSGFPNAAPSSGWIGRWLDGLGTADLYTAASIGDSLPLHMVGSSKRGTAVPPWGFGFGGRTDASSLRMYDGVRQFSAAASDKGVWRDSIARAERTQIDLAQSIAPVFDQDIEEDGFIRSMVVAARLINADMGFRVLDVSLDGFDNHSSEPGDLAELLKALDDGIRAFYATLNPTFGGRVTLMTFSEFGRTPWSNDSIGTDHGTAAPHFVIGGTVQGGIYGEHPLLTYPNGSAFDEWERLTATADFRSLYATMIDGVLGGGASTVLRGEFEKFPLFRPVPVIPQTPTMPGGGSVSPGSAGAGGGGGGGSGGGTASVEADFVGMVPVRLLDTRSGGGPLGAAASLTLPVAGDHGIPAGAVAAVLNVTAVNASSPSYLTVWPSGPGRPNTSSLNTAGNDIVPNLVITKLGGNGAVDIYNNAGTVDVVVDVVGWFQSEPAARFGSLAPTRILDTRIGQGAPAGAVAAGGVVDLQVAGQGGVDPAAEAVVLNVTVTEPTGAGYVTVWPSGAEMPTASNLNFVPGQTVPNLVIAKLGEGGRVSLFNSAGSTHVIADVLGCFTGAGGGRLTSLPPARLLDTRSDSGAPAPVDQAPLVLPVLGRGGVPGAGVSAVVLNVTATESTADGYVTVYPTGQEAPTASNLNTRAGQTRANLVIAKVGPDGAVAMFNSGGTVHLIADVVGYFSG